MMRFKRGQDIKDALDIGMTKAIQKVIRKHIASPLVGWTGAMREEIVKDVKKLTGWEEVKDITSYDYPHIFKFRCVDPKENRIRVISINSRDEF